MLPSGQNDSQGSHDQRAHARLPVHEKASICVLGRERRVRCDVLDLSLGGCRLRLLESLSLAQGDEVEGTFRIRGAPLRLVGTVCWTNEKDTVGIRFRTMSARCKQILQEAVDEIASHKKLAVQEAWKDHLARVKY